MSVIAFDFDGVIADSIYETYIVSSYAYRSVTKEKFMSERTFKKYRSFVKSAEDFFSVMILLKNKKPVSFRGIKEANKKYQKECSEFAGIYYEYRHKLIDGKDKGWIGSFKFHKEIIKIIDKLSKESSIFIVTTRDKKSVSYLLNYAGVQIRTENIVARDFSVNKLDQLKHISEMTKTPVAEIIIVDDIVDHLTPLKKLGIKTILASWGYCTADHIKEAKKLGIKVATKDNLEKIIRGSMDEYFDVVDENNNIISRATRKECHTKGLWHRAVHIIIVNSKGEILLQKRSMKKDLYKGYWIDAAAGHVDSDETYEETAERELKEELGISTKLTKLFDFKKYTGNDNEIIRVFGGKHDGPFRINKEEVDFVEFFTLDKINKKLKTEQFTPATVEVFKEISKNPNILKRLRL